MKEDCIPVVYFDHMTTKFLLQADMANIIKSIEVSKLHEISRRYTLISARNSTDMVGVVNNIDVFEDDLEEDKSELSKIYSDEYLKAISASKSDIEESFIKLMDALFLNKWKTNQIQISVIKFKSFKDSFRDIIYSIIQKHYIIKSQLRILSSRYSEHTEFQKHFLTDVEEYAYIIERKENM